MTATLRDHGVEIEPDPSRVLARLFLPGEGFTRTGSRAAGIIQRVDDLTVPQRAAEAAAILADFGSRHLDLAALLARNATTVAFRLGGSGEYDADHEIVLGAAFTAEHSVEAAAICNPSAMVHPDQTGLASGELRVAISLRAIGEGHVSSIAFASAVVGHGGSWRFEPRDTPLVTATVTDGEWTRPHFRDVLEAEGRFNELSGAIVRALPARFTSSAIESAINDVPAELAKRRAVREDLDTIRTLAASVYRAEFDASSSLPQRVLVPVAAEEQNGMEDARFTLFTGQDGIAEYRATYTAYDGRSVAPRLIVSPDLRRFAIHRLTGTASVNKGMALFPRPIGGRQWALTRTDGQDTSLAVSDDGLSWADTAVLVQPDRLWDIVQTGNCGPPIETERGWLVLLHGVGPMRRYSLSAMLLDRDDPSKVLARLEDPMLQPGPALQDGYVPNVVYSCGGIVHDGTLWLPYGVGDDRVRVGSIDVTELLDAMVPV